MRYDPEKHHRRSIRLHGYDYSQPGWYFITICTRNRESLFGEIVNGKMILNDAGTIVRTEWVKTGKIRQNIKLDKFVIMPNHLHGIIKIVAMSDIHVGAHSNVSSRQTEQFGKSTQNTIPTIIKLFKSTTTKQINQMQNTPGLKLWQRNYYEHIIRDGHKMARIREYITNNPAQWATDQENPMAKTHHTLQNHKAINEKTGII